MNGVGMLVGNFDNLVQKHTTIKCNLLRGGIPALKSVQALAKDKTEEYRNSIALNDSPYFLKHSIGIPVSPISNGKCNLCPLHKEGILLFYSHFLKFPQPLPSISLLVQRQFYPGGIIDVIRYFISPVVAIHSCMIK